MSDLPPEIEQAVQLPPEIEKAVQHMLPPNLLHDLRTPLGHILGYSELLIEQMKDAGREEYIPYLEKIRKAGHELLGLMTDNFQATRPNDGG
ncbi:MAG TPA: histidine kinase dimerization/phospho-acceptor domain-containing protein [Gemmatimonadaceae bacterium]|nr:histidine kinase dimerization/phospho-acceptor domain-containing protein [Gemmatimonadaceae bacterium]